MAVTVRTCSDCEYPTDRLTDEALARGSSVREPGEVLCGSCTSRRVLMMREVDKIPGTIDLIRDKRRVIGAA